MENETCNRETEVFSRVVGYYRPVNRWNEGKREEFADRVTFDIAKALESDMSGVNKAAEAACAVAVPTPAPPIAVKA